MSAGIILLGSLLGLTSLLGVGCGDKDDGDGDGDGTITDGGSTGDGGGTTAPVDADGDGVSPDDGDCDDTDPLVYPGRAEDCDGVDQNCNDVADEGFTDTDGDTVADCVDVEECDGADNDGDGEVDEGFDSDGDGVPDCEADEVCDGVDNDGDGEVDEGFDNDRDGFTTCGSEDEGADCDDTDAAVNPDAEEDDGDLVDNDCDGMVDEGEWSSGDLFVTEIMNNPLAASDPNGEWFEIYNDSGRDLVLNGLVITSTVDDDWHQVSHSELVWIAPGEHLVLGINSDPVDNGEVDVAYMYAHVELQNESDDLVLMFGDRVIDEVAWDDGASMPDPQGATISLDPSYYGNLLNDASAAWCESSFPWATNADAGSPGEENEFCWPIAEASYSASSSLYTCDELQLIGSESYDPDGASVSFEWELVSAPAGSALTSDDITETTSADPVIVPDEPGTYQFALTVFNGTVYSDPVYVTVVITERPYNTDPVADAGDDRTYSGSVACTPISYGAYYTCDACDDAEFDLDATSSYDPDDDEIVAYTWEITGGTGEGSIDDTDSPEATLTMTGPDTTYGDTTSQTVEVTLTVEDCMGATDTDVVVFTYECSGT
ncbi:lamin tail domain-containing protein [Myxococcota bacterium]|nr:lamin tail domain-containing protein [Myxococcota bacterium]